MDASRNHYLAGLLKQQALQWAEMRRNISTGILGCVAASCCDPVRRI